MKGTSGLGAVFDRFAGARPLLVPSILVLVATAIAARPLLDDPLLVAHVDSALVCVGALVVAFTVPHRPAIIFAVGASTWLIVDAVASGVSLIVPLPVATLSVASTVLIVMIRNTITRHEMAQATLERHRNDLEDSLAISYRQVSYAETLSTAARAYLAGADVEAREAALAELLHATDADVVRVTRNATRGDGGLHAIVEAIVADTSDPGWKGVEEFAWAGSPNVMSLLAANRRHVYSRLSDIEHPDRRAYERRGARYRSGIDMPIVVDGRWEGTIGVGCSREGRAWRDGEITLVRSVADMVAAAWAREHAVRRLGDAIDERDRSLRLQAALTDSSRALLESHSENSLLETLAIVRSAVGAQIAYLESSIDGLEGPRRVTMHAVTGADGEPPERDVLWSLWPSAYAELNKGRPYIVDDIDQLPDRERSSYVISDSPLKAELSFPVFHDGRLVAVVGIGDDRPRRWTATEMRMMGSVAHMIGAYWQRDAVRRALEDLIRSKDRLIASVSHELRTPMAVVLGLSTELNTHGRDFGEEEADEFIGLIARQAREVTHIVEDLLVSARATETTITVLPEPIRLDFEVQEVLADLPDEYTSKVETVEVEEMTAMADPVRTRQILRNLITNSHRYGGDRVTIRGWVEEDLAHLIVHDDGSGIPAERAEEIFEAYTTSGERTGMTAAIGLGLTVSRQLARLMGGDVVYRLDGGSVFDLSLPGAALATDTRAVGHRPTDPGVHLDR